jgi:hypothetical protein
VKFPALAEDEIQGMDTINVIGEYRDLVVDQLDDAFPRDFPLRSVLEKHLPGHELEPLFPKLESGTPSAAEKAGEHKPSEPKASEEKPSGGR